MTNPIYDKEKTYNNTPWTLEEAQIFISKIEPIAETYGWTLLLHGSVLLKGFSKNDLDIVALSRNRTEFLPNEKGFLEYLEHSNWVRIRVMHLPDRNLYIYVKDGKTKLDISFVDMNLWNRFKWPNLIK